MANTIEAAIHVVGGLMLENLQIQAARIGGALLPETMIPDVYDAALNEFQDLHKANAGNDFEPPGDFRQRCIDHVTCYLEQKGVLA